MDERDIEEYLHKGKYIGLIEGDYDYYCELKLEEINNFVQNVGLHTNVEIVRETVEDTDVLFNTCGTFINRIWPELSSSDRDAFRTTINKMAGRLIEEFDKDKQTEILPKVQNFLTEALNIDIQKHLSMKEILDTMNEIEMQ